MGRSMSPHYIFILASAELLVMVLVIPDKVLLTRDNKGHSFVQQGLSGDPSCRSCMAAHAVNQLCL